MDQINIFVFEVEVTTKEVRKINVGKKLNLVNGNKFYFDDFMLFCPLVRSGGDESHTNGQDQLTLMIQIDALKLL